MTNTDPYAIAIHTNERRARLLSEANEAQLVRRARRANTGSGLLGWFRGLATPTPATMVFRADGIARTSQRPAAC